MFWRFNVIIWLSSQRSAQCLAQSRASSLAFTEHLLHPVHPKYVDTHPSARHCARVLWGETKGRWHEQSHQHSLTLNLSLSFTEHFHIAFPKICSPSPLAPLKKKEKKIRSNNGSKNMGRVGRFPSFASIFGNDSHSKILPWLLFLE